jgi:hypothetical protein
MSNFFVVAVIIAFGVLVGVPQAYYRWMNIAVVVPVAF